MRDRRLPSRKRAKKGQRDLYAFEVEDIDAVKIGIANDVERRLQEIQVATPLTVKLMRVWPGLACLERSIHQRVADHRIRGEWFTRSAPAVSEILCANADRLVSLLDAPAKRIAPIKTQPVSRFEPFTEQSLCTFLEPIPGVKWEGDLYFFCDDIWEALHKQVDVWSDSYATVKDHLRGCSYSFYPADGKYDASYSKGGRRKIFRADVLVRALVAA